MKLCFFPLEETSNPRPPHFKDAQVTLNNTRSLLVFDYPFLYVTFGRDYIYSLQKFIDRSALSGLPDNQILSMSSVTKVLEIAIDQLSIRACKRGAARLAVETRGKPIQ